MKKILALGASNSSTSINKQLARYAASKIADAHVQLIDINDFEMPLYGIDKERSDGIPAKAREFKKLIEHANGIVISFAEHNGSYSAAFKNLVDWTSRLEGKLWMDTPMFLMATSPGGRGGSSVLQHAVNDYPHRGGHVIESFSLPSFNANFENGAISNHELEQELTKKIELFISNL